MSSYAALAERIHGVVSQAGVKNLDRLRKPKCDGVHTNFAAARTISGFLLLFQEFTGG